MVVIAETSNRQSLDSLVKHLGDHYSLELLRFWGRYPCTRFGKLAIIHALNENGSRLPVERALTNLIQKGMVKTVKENGAQFYSLAEDEATRRLAQDLARLEWHQWQQLLRQAYPLTIDIGYPPVR